MPGTIVDTEATDMSNIYTIFSGSWASIQEAVQKEVSVCKTECVQKEVSVPPPRRYDRFTLKWRWGPRTWGTELNVSRNLVWATELGRKPGLLTRQDPRAHHPPSLGRGRGIAFPGQCSRPPEPPRGRSCGGFRTRVSRVAGRMGFVRRWKSFWEAAISPSPARLPFFSFLPGSSPLPLFSRCFPLYSELTESRAATPNIFTFPQPPSPRMESGFPERPNSPPSIFSICCC